MLGDAQLAVEMAQRLLGHGIYVIGFSYPVVPKGQARIRVQLSAAHSTDDVDRAIAAFADGRQASSGSCSVKADAIIAKIRAALPDAVVELQDLTGTEDHWKATIVSAGVRRQVADRAPPPGHGRARRRDEGADPRAHARRQRRPTKP